MSLGSDGQGDRRRDPFLVRGFRGEPAFFDYAEMGDEQARAWFSAGFLPRKPRELRELPVLAVPTMTRRDAEPEDPVTEVAAELANG